MDGLILKVGFTGTRDGLTVDQSAALRKTLESLPIVEMHHGDCKGADAAFHAICRDVWPAARSIGHPPDMDGMRAFCEFDEAMPPLPYMARNHAIVDACEILLACPDGKVERVRSGTWATVRYARKQGKRIVVIFPDGSVREEGPRR